MEFDRVKRASHIPNLTPLIDIVLLLLVFFLLTAHFVRDESIDIDLPKADSANRLDQNDRVELVIDKDGVVRLNGDVVEASNLETGIRNALKFSEEKSVQIRGDSDSDLGVAVSILDAARKAGADGVDIITKRP